METQNNELFLYRMIETGELEIKQDGTIWRLKKRYVSKWDHKEILTPCDPERAEVLVKGYLKIRQMSHGVRKNAAAHRLVWIHLKGPIPDGMTINHKNGITSDNRLENLELATPKEQSKHAYDVLNRTRAGPKGEANSKTHLMEADIRAIRQQAKMGGNLSAIAMAFSLSRDAAYRIVTRRSWRHVE